MLKDIQYHTQYLNSLLPQLINKLVFGCIFQFTLFNLRRSGKHIIEQLLSEQVRRTQDRLRVVFQQLDIMGHCIEIVLSYCFKLLCRREMKHHLLWHQNVELERTNTLEERLKEKLAWKAFFPFFFLFATAAQRQKN